MPEYLFHCPVCNRSIQLGSPQPNRKRCPQCTIQQIQDKIIRDNDQLSKRYREYLREPSPDPLLRPPRPLTHQQLMDALLNAKIKEQLKQCPHCIYSSGKGINLFCDHVTQEGHACEKGTGPGDCRSFCSKAHHKK